MKKLSVFLVVLVIVLAFAACGDGAGGGWGGSGDYTVTINNIHPGYNNMEINQFFLLDAASSDATSPDNDSTVLNGSITSTFGAPHMAKWGGIKVSLIFFRAGGFESTATFPLSQKKIVIDAKDMLGRGTGRRLSEAPYTGGY